MKSPRVLLVRTDRIGDVVLCTPAVQALHLAKPSWQISMMVRGPVAQVLRGLPELHQVLEFQEASFWSWVRRFKAQRFDAVLFFRFDWKVALACLFAGVKIRCGPISNLGSRLLLSVGMRQRRSRVDQHEADYNTDLLKMLGVDAQGVPARVQVPAPEKEWGQRFLTELGLDSYWVIHPGMGGSAENWPLQNYRILAEELLKEGRNLLITVGPQDDAVREAFRSLEHSRLRKLEELALPQLAFVLGHAELVIAPSTGPLHLAAALGVPVAGFYPSSPQVETARRWGPRGAHPGSIVLTPEEGRPLSSLTVEHSLEKLRSNYGQR